MLRTFITATNRRDGADGYDYGTHRPNPGNRRKDVFDVLGHADTFEDAQAALAATPGGDE